MAADRLLSAREAVAYLHTIGLAFIKMSSLERHRHRGTGPKFRKIGGRAYYEPRDLDAWRCSVIWECEARDDAGLKRKLERLFRRNQRSS